MKSLRKTTETKQKIIATTRQSQLPEKNNSYGIMNDSYQVRNDSYGVRNDSYHQIYDSYGAMNDSYQVDTVHAMVGMTK